MAETAEWLIETRDLTRIYGDGEAIHALDGVDLRIGKGEFLAVMGPSGSGKSTLLNLLGALDKPTRGEVFINGRSLAKIKNKDEFRAHMVGFIFQMHNLLPTQTARENIEVPMIGHVSWRIRRQRSGELLELVGLSDRMNHLPNQLSGGQRQRVAVARALANSPALVLADEPTGNLDTNAGQDLMNLLRDLNQSQGTTFVVVTHDPSVARQTRRVVVMEDGKIVREDLIGSPLEEDLKIWRHSGLGQLISRGETDVLIKNGYTQEQVAVLKTILAAAE